MAWADKRVIVRFRKTTVGATTAAVQADAPLPGLKLNSLIGKDYAFQVPQTKSGGVATAAATADGGAASDSTTTLPPDATMVFEITGRKPLLVPCHACTPVSLLRACLHRSAAMPGWHCCLDHPPSSLAPTADGKSVEAKVKELRANPCEWQQPNARGSSRVRRSACG